MNNNTHKLKYLINIRKGKNPNQFMDTGLIPYLTMDYLRYRDKDIKYPQLDDDLIFIDKNEILVLWDGANAGEIIKSRKGILSSTMAHITSRHKSLKNNFLYYLLKNHEQVLKEFAGGTTIPHLSPSSLLHFSFFIPKLTEQTAIANFLDKKTSQIDKAIELKERTIALLKERKQIVIQDLVTGKKVWNQEKQEWTKPIQVKDSGVEWLGEIPEHWEVEKLKFSGKIYAGLSGKSGVDFSKEPKKNHKPYIPFTNIYNNTVIDVNDYHFVKIDEYEQQNYVKNNDLLFLMSSETLEDIGKNALFKDKTSVFLNSFCKGFRIYDKNVYPEYLNYLLLASPYREYFAMVARGFTRINLKQEYVLNMPILKLDLKEQQKIATFLDEKTAKIDKAIELKEQAIEKLKELKATLIDSAVTGKMKVNEK
ncbi:MAG: restriction endonuclease subunit S [Bacteroidales bacterium]|nr:restriction endonuclease subunit S [Bacteroidales bacterium]